MRRKKSSRFTREQRDFIVARYGISQSYQYVEKEFNRVYDSSDNEVKQVSDHLVMCILREEGVELKQIKKNGVPLLRRGDADDETRRLIIETYKRLGKGFLSFNEINEILRKEKGFYMENRIFETILKEGGVNLESDEYRYGSRGSREAEE